MSENIVILGAGIIGLSTAYYISLLASTDTTIHLLDTSPSLFASASGNAAGFLARDWFGPSTTSLGALSFDLHKKLAAEHGGAYLWGYSPSIAFSVSDVEGNADEKGENWLLQGTSRAVMAASKGAGTFPSWLEKAHGAEPISSAETTAQVNPLKLCEFLLLKCKSRNVQVHHPVTPVSLTISSAGTLTEFTFAMANSSLETLPCTTLLLTAGVWTPSLFRTLFPSSTLSLPIHALSGHSLVLHSPYWTPSLAASESCAAAFTVDRVAGFSAEIFSRAHGDIYIAGLNSADLPIEPLATDTHPDSAALAVLKSAAGRLLGVPEDDVDVVKGSLCHRPVTPTGIPLLTRLDKAHTGIKEGSVWVCAGHGPWGISMSLGTGLVLAELILGLQPSADVTRLGLK